MSRVLQRASLRYLRRHPWQLVLSILGVALGVAVVLAIDLANSSASRAFRISTASVTGKTTHQITGGTAGVPDSVYRKLRIDLGLRQSAPVITRYIKSSLQPGRVLQLLGVDPFAERPFRTYVGQDAEIDGGIEAVLLKPRAAIVSANLLQRTGLAVGASLPIVIYGKPDSLKIIGSLRATDARSRELLRDIIVMDIASAQELAATPGSITRIDLILPPEHQAPQKFAHIRAVLPDGLQLSRASTRTEKVEQMTAAFNLNLFALSLLALIVGMFLIYNAVTFSIVQRRKLIGTLRALGVTRSGIFRLVLFEALFVGLAGTAIGAGLGIVLGRGLLLLVTQTINDLYFVLNVRELSLQTGSFLKVGFLGIGSTLFAALLPAWEATHTPPRFVLAVAALESRLKRRLPQLSFAGVGALLLSYLVFQLPGKSIWLSLVGLLPLVIGFALLAPAITLLMMRLLRPGLSAIFGLTGRLAARNVSGQLSRTALAIAALAIAVGSAVGVGTMVSSFRTTIINWLETTLVADFYVSPPTLVSRRSDGSLPRSIASRASALPGIQRINTIRGARVQTERGEARLLAIDGSQRTLAVYSFAEKIPGFQPIDFMAGEDICVSEPFAYRFEIQAGDSLSIATPAGNYNFRVAAVFYDYASDVGWAMMPRPVYDRYWQDDRISGFSVELQKAANADSVAQGLQKLAGADLALQIRSNKILRESSIEIFDRTFAITNVLRLLIVIVAFIGVLSALMALQLERERELGILRASGLTPGQLWGLVNLQTGLMGFVAGLLALPLGLILSTILIFVINKRSFGWTLQLEFSPDLLLQALLLAVIAALMAGLYPAWKMSRSSPALALRAE